MATYSVDEAQKLLEELIDRARAGEQVLIMGNNGGVVQVWPISKRSKKRGEVRERINQKSAPFKT